MRELVIGGARSGKSTHAEQRALESGLRVVYVATAQVLDGEMERRVALHRARRPADWGLCEAPLQLAETLRREARSDTCLLVDCLTLWLTNWLMPAEEDASNQPLAQDWSAQAALFLEALAHAPGPVVVVGNEIGLGVIPLGAQVRAFVDALGVLNQQVAQVCPRVTLMAAGLPLSLKPSSSAPIQP